MSHNVSVCISFDFDAMSSWIANYRTESPNALSRGEFGRVGAHRALDLLNENDVPSTWFVPGHTIEAFPDTCERLLKEGHEIGHHGYCHENPMKMEIEEEKAILERGSALIEELTGRRPRGYRCPSGSFSPNTLQLLQANDFLYDTSMLGDDFSPYYARTGIKAPIDRPYDFGEFVDIVEMPFSWSLDDHPVFEHTRSRRGVNPGLSDPDRVFQIWSGDFDYLYNKMKSGVFILTLHPQVIGRGHRLLMLEKLIEHMKSHDGVSFRTLEAYAAAWKDANPFAEARLAR
jgi:peptidoglycan/xylan/chitin deacetylase (PgdA/CDA1 family)